MNRTDRWKWCPLYWVAFSIITSAAPTGNAPVPTPTLIEHEGRKYRIETEPDRQRIRVVYDLDQKPYPSGLILVMKRRNHLPRRIKLGITETTRDSVVYTGLVPSAVLISGGLTFEIGESR